MEMSSRSSRSKNRKPLSSGQWLQASVPLWEKSFCKQVPWQKILETKKMMSYHHDNVVQWNDSAGKEAFNNAKIRFWLEMNGLPCYIPLPDPDIYIDEIDWDSDIDSTELLFHLDPVLEEEEDWRRLGFVADNDDTIFLLNQLQTLQVTGWGDAAEDDPTVTTNVNSSSDPGLGGHRSCNEVPGGAVVRQDYGVEYWANIELLSSDKY